MTEMERYRCAAALLFLLALILTAPASAAVVDFRSELTSTQHPASFGNAFGAGALRLNAAGDRLDMLLTVFGLDFVGATPEPSDDVTAVRIRAAPAGRPGPAVFTLFTADLDPGPSLFDGGLGVSLAAHWSVGAGGATGLAAHLKSLRHGALYLCVETVAHPRGVLRGQILPVPAPLPPSAALLAAALGLVPLLGRRSAARPRATASAAIFAGSRHGVVAALSCPVLRRPRGEGRTSSDSIHERRGGSPVN